MRTTEDVVEDVLTDAQREAWRACRAPGEMPVSEFADATERVKGTVGNHLRWAEQALREASEEFLAVSRQVDFLTARDDTTSSFQRARDEVARVRYVSPVAYTVSLSEGEHRHLCTLHEDEQGRYRGSCDCKGWRFSDGPCAHLCALRMADYVHEETVDGREVRTPTVEADATRAVTDGGEVVEHAAGADGREFGRPEGRL
jgi:hypothetical protein